MNNKNILFASLVLVAVIAAYFIYTLNTSKTTEMKSTGDNKIDNLISKVRSSMEGYMKRANSPYSQKEIDECTALLSDYTTNIFKTHSKEEGMNVVKSTVLKLNALNEKCDYTLIETDEREQIAEIIILAGHKMGYNSVDEDITEKWREW